MRIFPLLCSPGCGELAQSIQALTRRAEDTPVALQVRPGYPTEWPFQSGPSVTSQNSFDALGIGLIVTCKHHLSYHLGYQVADVIFKGMSSVKRKDFSQEACKHDIVRSCLVTDTVSLLEKDIQISAVPCFMNIERFINLLLPSAHRKGRKLYSDTNASQAQNKIFLKCFL